MWPYVMHVSSRYLELTKNKLQLTRLPREVKLPEERRWDHGTPKGVLEPLLDFWLERYDWRTQESRLNAALPQFRTALKLSTTSSTASLTSTSPLNSASESLRIHFVHRASKHPNAIPLLLCYAWPSSFIEVQKIIDSLTDPQSLPSYGAGAHQAFHVVAPSIPGFGFSDASGAEAFGVPDTAAVFDKLMGRLGYKNYVVHGSGWGFKICRALALYHSDHCQAMHTANPFFNAPELKRHPVAYAKWKIARLTRARVACISFGYVPSDFEPRVRVRPGLEEKKAKGEGNDKATRNTNKIMDEEEQFASALGYQYTHRPQTLAYTLCDSPVGLLACMLDAIHTRTHNSSPTTSRSRSPFLSPSELELQDAVALDGDLRSQTILEEDEAEDEADNVNTMPLSPRDSELHAKPYTWTPTDLLNWTMMQWLPGPEASLRWLRQARLDSAPGSELDTTRSEVPLGISLFRSRNSTAPRCPVMWGEAGNRVRWVRRHARDARFPGWEAPDGLAQIGRAHV